MFEELNVPFTHEEFSKACSQLHTNNSAGPDKLVNEFFIYGKEILSTTLLSLFNSYLMIRGIHNTVTQKREHQ